ncbi:MAG: ABC transporter substrate-binding protein, partial [Synechococcales cyanobacterium RM1_1_8]|nr:ABC transporter substrate-binding protein [Synechococcales cyanobacterium RM1_1_8]
DDLKMRSTILILFPSPHDLPSAFTRRQALWLLTGLVGSLGLQGCDSLPPWVSLGKPAPPDPPTPTRPSDSIILGLVPWIGYAPFYVAAGKGLFARRNVVVEAKEFWAGADALASFAAGNLTAQAATNPEAVAQAARGVGYRIVMVADASAGSDGILARDGIKDVADFKGRQVAVDAGGASYYLLLQALKEKANLTINDIELVNLPADAAAQAYADGTVEIAVTYEPFLSEADQAQPQGRIFLDSAALPTAIMDVYLFQPRFVAQYPDKIQAFVDSLVEAQALIKAEPKEAERLIAAGLGITAAEVAEQLAQVELISLALNQAMLVNQTGGRSLRQSMLLLSEFLAQQGAIPSPLDEAQVAGLIDPQFVQAAKES